jgi:hypothetical protein
VELVGKGRQEVAELVRGRGEPAEEEQLGASRIAGLSVEHVESLRGHRLERRHLFSFSGASGARPGLADPPGLAIMAFC